MPGIGFYIYNWRILPRDYRFIVKGLDRTGLNPLKVTS